MLSLFLFFFLSFFRTQLRATQYERFRRVTTATAVKMFDMTLDRKGQYGELKIDHKERTLEMTVASEVPSEPCDGSHSLLVSLGEYLGLPFFVMDDVSKTDAAR